MGASKSFEKATRAIANDAEQRATSGNGGAGVPDTVGTAPALVAGQSSAPIAANITTASKFFFTLADPHASTTLGIPHATSITPGQPGSFVVTSATIGTPGTPQPGDVSSYNYIISEP